MATLLFNDFIGGPNVLPIRKMFAQDRQTLAINLGTDITGWTLAADYQTLIIDPVAYDRSGTANFTDSVVLGSFAKGDLTAGDAPAIVDAALGDITVTLPKTMYTGPMLPSARSKVPVVVVGLSWTDTDSNVTTLRIPIMMSYEPETPLGDPTTDAGYTALGA